MYPQYKTYNKDNFCDFIVLLYKGWGKITDISVASYSDIYNYLTFLIYDIKGTNAKSSQ